MRAGAALALLVVLAAPGAARAFDLEVTAPPALASTAARVEAIDREQLARDLAAAGLDPPARVRIALTAEDDPRARVVPSWIVGRAYGVEAVEIFPARVGAYPHGSLEAVVRHEIVHLALNQRARGRPLPRWFHEGVATSVEAGWSVTGQARLLFAAFGGPAVEDVMRLFASEEQPSATLAYLLSTALVDDVRRQHGMAVPGAIAGGVGEGLPFALAFERATGEGVDAAAARAWAGYRRVSRWLPLLASPSSLWLGIVALALVAFVVQVRRRRARRRQWDLEGD